MSDGFDDDADVWCAVSQPGTRHRAAVLEPLVAARLYLYISADRSLRAGMLDGLLRPSGPLGLAAIASGAIEDASRFGGERVFELAHGSEQVDLDRLVQLTFPRKPDGLELEAGRFLGLP